MKALISTATKRTERVFLVGVELKSRSAIDTRESLEELSELAATAGGEVIGEGTQKMEAPVAGTFIGSGKADEFARHCQRNKVDTVIFDDELSPAQSRNLERVFDCKVLDRTSLILDIFAQRARTREGKLQIELAQLQHLLPRLTRFWGHLSRQKGGIGMRGDGETQLETDRRRVQDRISKIARELEVVRRQRSTQRHGRQRNLWPLASIVGYTNAGKSTLLNALTGSQVLAEDKLFATLDPTTRRLRLPTNQNVLLTNNAHLDMYQGSLLYEIWASSKVRPYVVGGIGFTHFDSHGILSFSDRFSYNLGGGVKYLFAPHPALRAEMRWSPSRTTSSKTTFCDPFLGCFVTPISSHAEQGQANIGLEFRF